jgi:hypothetical protein
MGIEIAKKEKKVMSEFFSIIAGDSYPDARVNSSESVPRLHALSTLTMSRYLSRI